MFKAQGKEPALTGWVTWKHPHKLPSQGTCSSFILSVALKPHGLKELKLGEPRGEQVKYSRGLLCPSGAQWPWPPANKLPRMLPPSRAPAQPPRKGGCVISKRANGWGIQHFPLHDLPRFLHRLSDAECQVARRAHAAPHSLSLPAGYTSSLQ